MFHTANVARWSESNAAPGDRRLTELPNEPAANTWRSAGCGLLLEKLQHLLEELHAFLLKENEMGGVSDHDVALGRRRNALATIGAATRFFSGHTLATMRIDVPCSVTAGW